MSSVYGLLTSITESTTDTSTSTTSSYSLTTDDFITLLCTELENQGIEDTMSTTEMVSMFADLSTISSQEETNDYLASLVNYQQASFNSGATQLIGDEIVVEGNTLTVSGGEANSIVLNSDDAVSDVTITVYDEDGEQVASFSAGNLSSGYNTIDWDGTGDDGEALPDGNYTYKASSSDSDAEIDTYSTQTVESVVFRDGGAYLVTASGDEIDYADVIQVQ